MTLPKGLKAVRERAEEILQGSSSPVFREWARGNVALLDLIETLAGALEKCANDLEAEVKHRYGEPVHKALQHKFERDIKPVGDARAALDKYREFK